MDQGLACTCWRGWISDGPGNPPAAQTRSAITAEQQPASTTTHLSLRRGEAFGIGSRVWLAGTSLVGGEALVSGGACCCGGTGNPSPRII